ncbi:MAG: M20/M25/M40 family metallo-hydrolase [Proteobacteria bacterium]|nr:M20/M25/M40 family metallo-hydrolase [Pseudomonadota bacterium]
MNINKNRLVERFLDYVSIDSETGDEEEFANHLLKELAELGHETTRDKIGNVIVRIKGVEGYTPLLLSAHMDTVSPGKGIVPIVENDVISSKGDTVLGADDKGGVAIIMETLQSLSENNVEHGNLEVVFTVAEEGGLVGSSNLDCTMIKSRVGLVVDSSGDFGGIITQAPAQNTIVAIIKGKAAHAGNAPEKGVSAIQVAAQAINDMNLLRVDHETTANIGTISGGYATNIVCPEVTMEAEVRSLDSDKLESHTQHLVSCIENAAKSYGAIADIEIQAKYSAFKIPDNDQWVKFMIAAGKEMGIDSKARVTGGGSDANVFNLKGIKTLNIAFGMTKVHTVDEFIKIEDLVNASEYLLEIIKKMNRIEQ